MEQFRLLDLDNCCANDGWRIPKIDWSNPDLFQRYHDYHLLQPWDAAGNIDLFTGIPEAIVIVTSRPLFYRASTIEWLRRHGVHWRHLLMRNTHDHRSSVSVKESLLLSLPEYGVELSNIEAAYDDRPEVLDMYRSHGVTAIQRALHDVCAYVNPHTGHNHADGSTSRS